jgi:hypothetical protein
LTITKCSYNFKKFFGLGFIHKPESLPSPRNEKYLEQKQGGYHTLAQYKNYTTKASKTFY